MEFRKLYVPSLSWEVPEGALLGNKAAIFLPFLRKGGELVRHREKREAAQRLKKEEDGEAEEASLKGGQEVVLVLR